MTKVLILGANGHIARQTLAQIQNQNQTELTLYLRQPQRLKDTAPKGSHLIAGDVLDADTLNQAVSGQDIVYANLSGTETIIKQAQAVVNAMTQNNVQRLIWISTLGIYDEVPGNFGKWNHQMLDDGYLPNYAAAAQVIEKSTLNYTIIRPAWLDDKDEVDFETTQKDEPFKGTEVSRKSVGAYVAQIIADPTQANHASVGLNKPNTKGDKPGWY